MALTTCDRNTLAYEDIWCLFHQLRTSTRLLLRVATRRTHRKQPRSQMAQMSIDLTLKKDLRRPAKVLLFLTLSGSEELSSGPLALRFDTLEPALERTSDQVTQLHADDAHGEIHFATHGREQQDDRTFQVWRSSRTVDGPLHVSYIVPMASPHPPKRGPASIYRLREAAYPARSSVCITSETARTSTSRARMAYDQLGSRAVSTFAYGNSSVLTTINELENTLFLAGRLQMYPAKPPATGFSMYALGLAPGTLNRRRLV